MPPIVGAGEARPGEDSWPSTTPSCDLDVNHSVDRSLARRSRFEDQYVLAAVLIVASIIVYAATGDHLIGRLSVVTVQAMTLVVILHASSASRRAITVAAALGAAGVLVTGLSVAYDRQTVGPAVVGALLALVGPVVIVSRLRRHLRVDIGTVAGSLCIYLLAGLFFAYIYRVIEILDTPFFRQHLDPGPVDFVYFSFVTLTTLGYGDLTARADLGRMLAICEALFGQLYLVSVVAILVGSFGRTRDDRAGGVAPEA